MAPRPSPSVGLLAALALSGCVSVSPRAFAPVLPAPPADRAAFERDFASCRSQVAADVSLFDAPADDPYGSLGAPTDILGGAVVLGALGAAILTAPNRTRTLRTRAEQRVQAAMTNCLQSHGHAVAGWEPTQGETAGGVQTPVRSDKRTKLLLEAQAHEADAESDPKRRAHHLKLAAKARRKAERLPPPPEPPQWWYEPGKPPPGASPGQTRPGS